MATDSAKKKSPSTEPAFEEIVQRLETVVDKLERGDLPLEQSLAMFEEGVKLSRLGGKRLDEAEKRVELLLADGEGLTTRPFNDEEEE
ncbi:MAG: exodeoxyribonuclease VII small subunit [Sandaracinaceae bacterium]|jgi:exodeoxyribonuclease VII small subunit|nr:exodeoxyribonuclease VII small subunit [Sandaracinaceae bacterium]